MISSTVNTHPSAAAFNPNQQKTSVSQATQTLPWIQIGDQNYEKVPACYQTVWSDACKSALGNKLEEQKHLILNILKSETVRQKDLHLIDYLQYTTQNGEFIPEKEKMWTEERLEIEMDTLPGEWNVRAKTFIPKGTIITKCNGAALLEEEAMDLEAERLKFIKKYSLQLGYKNLDYIAICPLVDKDKKQVFFPIWSLINCNVFTDKYGFPYEGDPLFGKETNVELKHPFQFFPQLFEAACDIHPGESLVWDYGDVSYVFQENYAFQIESEGGKFSPFNKVENYLRQISESDRVEILCQYISKINNLNLKEKGKVKKCLRKITKIEIGGPLVFLMPLLSKDHVKTLRLVLHRGSTFHFIEKEKLEPKITSSNELEIHIEIGNIPELYYQYCILPSFFTKENLEKKCASNKLLEKANEIYQEFQSIRPSLMRMRPKPDHDPHQIAREILARKDAIVEKLIPILQVYPSTSSRPMPDIATLYV